ncbi:MAG TPA: DNA-formamidopyrimidine glycosylase [Thermomicrobiales bacterium]|nr:DNA-formamidopyrimidine glycosylase [Thermomicrobiales bacterium]
MPELPEVETVRRTLGPLITGRSIAGFVLCWDRTVARMDGNSFLDLIIDRTIVDVNRRGKLVILELSDGARVSVHLRMTGELFALPADRQRVPDRERYLRALFSFDDGSSLAFYDVRKFGRICYLTPGDYEDVDRALGVEPLSAAFSVDCLHSILSSRSRAIKPLLLDQIVIAGLGNIYVDEALFAAGIHPLMRAHDISVEQARLLHRAIVEILSASIDRRGTTLRDYRGGVGEPGQNQSHLRIYGIRPGHPCTSCGYPVARLVVGQRGTVYCPRCQLAPEYALSITDPINGSSS